MSLKAAISKRIIKGLEKRTPEFFRSMELKILTDLAAESFGVAKGEAGPAEAVGSSTGAGPVETMAGPTEEGSPLDRYALFTCRCMEEVDAEPGLLFHKAYELGAKIRRVTGLTDEEDLKRLVFLLYRNIGIDMSGDIPGEITVSRCAFARYYSPHQCQIMSNVDSGIISGLYGGGALDFQCRLTEGCPCCRARFAGKNERPRKDEKERPRKEGNVR